MPVIPVGRAVELTTYNHIVEIGSDVPESLSETEKDTVRTTAQQMHGRLVQNDCFPQPHDVQRTIQNAVDAHTLSLDRQRIGLNHFEHARLTIEGFVLPREAGAAREEVQAALDHVMAQEAPSTGAASLGQIVLQSCTAHDPLSVNALRVIKQMIPNGSEALSPEEEHRKLVVTERLFDHIGSILQARSPDYARRTYNPFGYDPLMDEARSIFAEALKRLYHEDGLVSAEGAIRRELQDALKSLLRSDRNAALRGAGQHFLGGLGIAAIPTGFGMFTVMLGRTAWTLSARQDAYAKAYDDCYQPLIEKCPIVPVSASSVGPASACAHQAEQDCVAVVGNASHVDPAWYGLGAFVPGFFTLCTSGCALEAVAEFRSAATRTTEAVNYLKLIRTVGQTSVTTSANLPDESALAIAQQRATQAVPHVGPANGGELEC